MATVEVELKFTSGHREDTQVERLVPATETFHWWSFWYPEDKDGMTRARFIKDSELLEVNLFGKEQEEKLASVTPIRGGDDTGTI